MSYSQKERDLIGILEDDLHYSAMRAPASGGATDRDLPDVIAGRSVDEGLMSPDRLSDVWNFEVKYRSEPAYYFDKEDVSQLVDFALLFGGTPRLAFRWNANKSFCYGDSNWYLMRPTDAEFTETKCKVRYEDVVESCPTVQEALDP